MRNFMPPNFVFCLPLHFAILIFYQELCLLEPGEERKVLSKFDHNISTYLSKNIDLHSNLSTS